MEVKGTVKNGVVVMDSEAALPEGASVIVRYDPPAEAESPRDPNRPYTLREKMLKLAGTVPGLPEDFADQHDHYIHGTPKQ